MVSGNMMLYIQERSITIMLPLSFIVQYRYIFILIVLGIFVFSAFLLLFSRKKRKKLKKDKERKETPPITNIIGTKPERIYMLNRDLEPFGFAYDLYQDSFYSLMSPWQRKFGYCRLYDEACAPLSMIIDCEPIRFQYKGRKFLIEFWKGQYGMTTGAEVGIYYTDGPDLSIPGVFNGTFYKVVKDEDLIYMSFAFRKNGNLLFTRSGYHWWLTAFKLGEFSYPNELSMEIILDLYDAEMAHTFARALVEAGYTESEYAVRGRRVYVLFEEPHTKQPYTRTSLQTFLSQKNNKHWCDTYFSLSSQYTDTVDKIQYIRNESPDMYEKIMNMGKVPEVYSSYQKIKTFIVEKES